MNDDKLEKLILLEQSGELSARQRKQLVECEGADQKRAELLGLLDAVSVSDEEPSAWAATKIAARLRSEPASLFEFSRLWKPALALVACLTLFVNSFDFTRATPAPLSAVVVEEAAWISQFDDDLEELESLISTMSGDSLSVMEL